MRVLLTGAFGNVGAHVLDHLVQMGYEVTCFDLKNKINERKRSALTPNREFHTVWGDLRDEAAVAQIVASVKPSAILHAAEIPPPFAYMQPALAYETNVNGTRRLITAAEKLDPPPKFVFASSYLVHGPRNPHKASPLITGNTPLNPGDNYGRHKVAAETLLRESKLPWTIIRLASVFEVNAAEQTSPAVLKWLFLLPYERRQHGIDGRDAGLALANAIPVEAEGRTFAVAGAASWEHQGGELLARVFQARGLRALPPAAFRLPDPNVDGSWYYEDWINTKESTAVLCYQQHTFKEYLVDVRQASGAARRWQHGAAPMIQWRMLRTSPYYRVPRTTDPRTHWQVVCEAYGVPPDT